MKYSLKKIKKYYRLYINDEPSKLGYTEKDILGRAKLDNQGAPIVKGADVYIPTGYPSMLQNGQGMYSLKAIMVTNCVVEIYGPMLTPHHAGMAQNEHDLGTNFPWNNGQHSAVTRIELAVESPNPNNLTQAQHWAAITTIIYKIISDCKPQQPSNKILKDFKDKHLDNVIHDGDTYTLEITLGDENDFKKKIDHDYVQPGPIRKPRTKTSRKSSRKKTPYSKGVSSKSRQSKKTRKRTSKRTNKKLRKRTNKRK